MTSIPLSLDERVNLGPEEFVRSLTKEEKMVIWLKEDIYHSWQGMRDDLKERLAKRPYLYLLAEAIDKDLEVIGKLEAYETKHKINLFSAELTRDIN